MQFTFIKRAKLLVTNTISEFLSKSSKTMWRLFLECTEMKPEEWRVFFDYCKTTDVMSMENWFNFVSRSWQ
jgi:hypothetical protein